MKKQYLAAALLGFAATLTLSNAAFAQGYPTRPITFIVPYGAGGPVDVLARTLTEAMRPTLGQPIVIENVVGANGTIGVGRAVRAEPDGYTVSIGNWPSHITNGAIYNLSGVYVQKITGTQFQFVPYKAGSSDIIRDIIAGHIDFTFDQAITSLQHIKSGNVKAYAVTSDKRLDAAPDIPTVDEAGAPGTYILTWYGLWVPKGTPQVAIDKLGEAARAALANPAVREKLLSLGQQIPPPEQQTAAALAAFTKAEIDKWHAIIKEAGIKAE